MIKTALAMCTTITTKLDTNKESFPPQYVIMLDHDKEFLPPHYTTMMNPHKEYFLPHSDNMFTLLVTCVGS